MISSLQCPSRVGLGFVLFSTGGTLKVFNSTCSEGSGAAGGERRNLPALRFQRRRCLARSIATIFNVKGWDQRRKRRGERQRCNMVSLGNGGKKGTIARAKARYSIIQTTVTGSRNWEWEWEWAPGRVLKSFLSLLFISLLWLRLQARCSWFGILEVINERGNLIVSLVYRRFCV